MSYLEMIMKILDRIFRVLYEEKQQAILCEYKIEKIITNGIMSDVGSKTASTIQIRVINAEKDDKFDFLQLFDKLNIPYIDAVTNDGPIEVYLYIHSRRKDND